MDAFEGKSGQTLQRTKKRPACSYFQAVMGVDIQHAVLCRYNVPAYKG